MHPVKRRPDDARDVRIAATGISRTGSFHDNNEDRFLIADMGRWCAIRGTNSSDLGQAGLAFPKSQGVVLIVADGMTGQGHGDSAAAVVLETLWNQLVRGMPWPDDDSEAHRTRILSAMNKSLHLGKECLDRLVAQEGLSELHIGTTATIAYIAWPWMFIAHVGDGRVYLARNHVLYQLTQDQTAGQKMREHQYPEDQAKRFDHVLTNAIMANQKLADPQLKSVPLKSGDRILLCSDGLSSGCDEQSMVDMIVASSSVHTACDNLVQAAIPRTTDDITAVLASVTCVTDAGQS